MSSHPAPAAPPPAPEGPPKEKPAKKPLGPRGAGTAGPSHPNSKSGCAQVLLGAGAIAAVIAVIVILKGPSSEVTGPGAQYDRALVVAGGRPSTQPFEVVGKARYTMEVEATDGDLMAGVLKRSTKSAMSPKEARQIADQLQAVRSGGKETFTGELEAGTYVWVLFQDGKKPVKARIKFSAEPE